MSPGRPASTAWQHGVGDDERVTQSVSDGVVGAGLQRVQVDRSVVVSVAELCDELLCASVDVQRRRSLKVPLQPVLELIAVEEVGVVGGDEVALLPALTVVADKGQPQCDVTSAGAGLAAASQLRRRVPVNLTPEPLDRIVTLHRRDLEDLVAQRPPGDEATLHVRIRLDVRVLDGEQILQRMLSRLVAVDRALELALKLCLGLVGDELGEDQRLVELAGDD